MSRFPSICVQMFSRTRRDDNSRCEKPTAPHYSSDGGLALFHCGRTVFVPTTALVPVSLCERRPSKVTRCVG